MLLPGAKLLQQCCCFFVLLATVTYLVFGKGAELLHYCLPQQSKEGFETNKELDKKSASNVICDGQGQGGNSEIKIKYEHEFIEPSAELNGTLIKKLQQGSNFVAAFKKFKACLKVKLAFSLSLSDKYVLQLNKQKYTYHKFLSQCSYANDKADDGNDDGLKKQLEEASKALEVWDSWLHISRICAP